MDYNYQIKNFEDYQIAYKESIQNPELFWGKIAKNFFWKTPWNKVLEWEFETPRVEWFKGGKLNITENCLDRHVKNFPDKLAIIWEPNDPNQVVKKFTYYQLYKEVVKFSYVLKNIGVKKGDRVCVYMGMVPELIIAVLACARLGAIHSVIFGGFSAQSIKDRLLDAHAQFILTCDGASRGSKIIPLKSIIDEAIIHIDFIKKVVVLNHLNIPVSLVKDRDLDWQNECQKIADHTINYDLFTAETMEAEDPLFILYTSGSTGKPKGVVHSCAGYLVYTNYTFINAFNYQPNELFFCTADIGWITGHSYIVYGALSAAATVLMFEGIPTYPEADRFWQIIDKHKVNIFYTAPTAIRSLMTYGLAPLNNKNLSSLRVLGTVGEPINEEAWNWYNLNIGKNRCPIIDTWWQTETGGMMISNLATISAGKPGWATFPMPGVAPVLLDDKGEISTQKNEDGHFIGNLCLTQPWPSIIRTTYNNHQRCYENYFSLYPNLYFTGDGAILNDKGEYRITGRVDDVLNISGHRIGTAEIENVINSNTQVIESAVVGFSHPIKGQAIYAFIILDKKPKSQTEEIQLKSEIINTVTKGIGAIAKPDKIQFVSALPKTRSGKIMRRILRKIANNEIQNLGDTTTLLDPDIIPEIINNRQ